MLHFDEIVFGPIFSRRLGSSLGVNLLPSVGKLCNFDCVYCECGWNKDGRGDGRFPQLPDIEKALEEKMAKASAEGVGVDSITFSGNGEPTMHPDFAKVIDITLRLRDRYFPDAKARDSPPKTNQDDGWISARRLFRQNAASNYTFRTAFCCQISVSINIFYIYQTRFLAWCDRTQFIFL